MSDDGGRVPEFWGLREVDRFPWYEWDNNLRHMVSRTIYFSPRTNTDVSRYETNNQETFLLSQLNSQVYSRSPRGIPMNPMQARKPVTIVQESVRFSG